MVVMGGGGGDGVGRREFFKFWRAKTFFPLSRGRSRTPTASKMAFFVTVVNSQKPLTVFKKNLILDVTGFLVLALLF